MAALDSVFCFAGRPQDRATQLSQNGERWCDPASGRFLSEDPIGYNDGSNPYRYAGNDPVNFVDPTGLSQAGHPLNNLYGGAYAGGTIAPPPKPVNYNPINYGPRNTAPGSSVSTASLINSFNGPTRAPAAKDFDVYGLLEVPNSRPAVDVNAAYLSRYANDVAFRNRMDDEYALSSADYASRNGSNIGAFGGELLLTADQRINSSYSAATGLFTEPTFVAADIATRIVGNGGINHSSTFRVLNSDPRQIRDAIFQTETLSTGYHYFTNPTVENARAFSDNLFNTSTLLLGGTQARVRYAPNSSTDLPKQSVYQQPYQQQQGMGSYTNTHLSGRAYSGKGDVNRMNQSAREIAQRYDDPVVSQDYTPAPNTKQSFIDEQARIDATGGPGGNTYNKINSPGKKLR